MTTQSEIRDDLNKRISALRAERGDQVSLNEIASVVEALFSTMNGDLTARDLRLYDEINDLATYIQKAKTEIADLRPNDIRDDHIPSATDELDAIVSATEEATGKILDAVENVENGLGALTAEQAEPLLEQVTNIYEACNFQDITGQRISKVVKTLKYIDTKVDALLSVFGDEIATAKPAEETEDQKSYEAVTSRKDDDQVLGGPQAGDEAINQEDIDALFS